MSCILPASVCVRSKKKQSTSWNPVNEDSPNADRGLINESLSTEIGRALATLTQREADILRKFFGIGVPEKTLEEIGDELHLT